MLTLLNIYRHIFFDIKMYYFHRNLKARYTCEGDLLGQRPVVCQLNVPLLMVANATIHSLAEDGVLSPCPWPNLTLLTMWFTKWSNWPSDDLQYGIRRTAQWRGQVGGVKDASPYDSSQIRLHWWLYHSYLESPPCLRFLQCISWN